MLCYGLLYFGDQPIYFLHGDRMAFVFAHRVGQESQPIGESLCCIDDIGHIDVFCGVAHDFSANFWPQIVDNCVSGARVLNNRAFPQRIDKLVTQ